MDARQDYWFTIGITGMRGRLYCCPVDECLAVTMPLAARKACSKGVAWSLKSAPLFSGLDPVRGPRANPTQLPASYVGAPYYKPGLPRGVVLPPHFPARARTRSDTTAFFELACRHLRDRRNP